MEKKTRCEIDTMIRIVSNNARFIWLWNIKAAIREYGALELHDETDDENVPYVYTMDANHGCVYRVSFDKVNTEKNFNGVELCFHCVDGDGLFEDDSWVNEREFSGSEWEELLDHIAWPED